MSSHSQSPDEVALYADFDLIKDIDAGSSKWKAMLATKYAFNGKLNPRNIEHLCFNYLSIPRDHHLLSEPVEDDDPGSSADDYAELFNPDTSFQSDLTHFTIAEKPAAHFNPDFGILYIPYHCDENTNAFRPPWRGIHLLQGFHIPVLAETKRRVSRKLFGQALQDRVEAQLMLAQRSLEIYASVLFEEYPHQQEVLLIGLSGEFWCHRLFRRDHPRLQPLLLKALKFEKSADDSDNDDKTQDDDYVESQEFEAVTITDSRKRRSQRGRAPKRHQATTAQELGRIQGENICETLESLENRWSDMYQEWSAGLQFDTPESNQRLYVIECYLKKITGDEQDFFEPEDSDDEGNDDEDNGDNDNGDNDNDYEEEGDSN